MNLEELRKANEIADKIKRLDKFIFYSELRWTGRLIQKAKGFIFRSNAYGGLESKEIHLETHLRDKVLDVLRKEIKTLEQELSKF